MLHKIRKTANTTVFKIFLVVVAIAFAWGYRDYMRFGGNRIIVKFDDLDPITFENFHKVRAIEIQKLQHSSNTALTNEQVEEMNLSSYVLQRMVRSRLVEYLAQKFDLDFSDAKVASVIRSYPIFKDDNGIYNPERLKSYLRMNKLDVKEFSAENKNNIARDIIFSAFVGNAYIPKAKMENIINFATEKRSVDIAVIDLGTKRPNIKKVFEDQELENFYNENKEMFKTTWKRDICYIHADESVASPNIQSTEEEIKSFYKDNKDEFSGKKFASVKSDIKEFIVKEKFDKWISNLSKSLDDEVAGGSSLKEIAAKYKLPVKCERDLKASNIEARGEGIFSLFLGEISNMSEGEVSYPADIDDRGIILFEMKKYIAETLPQFASIRNKVVSKYQHFLNQQENLKRIHDIKQKTKAQNFVSAVSAQNMKVDLGKRYVRAKAAEYSNVPESMLHSIFIANKNEIIGPFIDGNKAYLYVVKSIGRDMELKNQITSDKSNLLNMIRDNLAEELLFFAQNDANMQVKTSIEKIMLPKSSEE
jgi:hypothetical protein